MVLVILYVIILLGTIFFGFTGMERNHGEVPSYFFASFAVLLICLLSAVLLTIGLLIYFMVHAIDNPKLNSDQKLIWVLILLFANGIGNIVYFFVEIVPNGGKTSDKTKN